MLGSGARRCADEVIGRCAAHGIGICDGYGFSCAVVRAWDFGNARALAFSTLMAWEDVLVTALGFLTKGGL